MTTGSNFWVIGGEFGSMNFHKLVEGSAQVQGPFKTRKEAEDRLARRSRKRTATRPAFASRSSKSPTASRPERTRCRVLGARIRKRSGSRDKCPRTDGPIRISGWGRLSLM